MAAPDRTTSLKGWEEGKREGCKGQKESENENERKTGEKNRQKEWKGGQPKGRKETGREREKLAKTKTTRKPPALICSKP